MRRLLLLLLHACGDAAPPQGPAPSDPIGARADMPPAPPVEERAEPIPREAPAEVDELVFGPSRAAYDLSGWRPRPLARRAADESYTASDYDFHYADVPGHPGFVRPRTS